MLLKYLFYILKKLYENVFYNLRGLIMLGGLIKKILGGFFPYMFDKNKALESKDENDYELEEVHNYENKGEFYQKKSLVKDIDETINWQDSYKKETDEKISNVKNDIEEELVSLFNKNSEINDKELKDKKFNLKSHRNIFYNTNYWEKLKSKLNKTENNKEDIIRSRDARIENKILENKRIEEKTLHNSKPNTSLEFKQTEKVTYENKNKIEEKGNLYNYKENNYKDNSYNKQKRQNLYTSFDKFYDKKLYDYKNTAKVNSEIVDNGNNIQINDLRTAKNIKLVNYNMSNKVDTSLENSIQVNDLRKNDMNNNNLVKDANYYVKLGKEIAKNNFNN
jgi:hypothetical protein